MTQAKRFKKGWLLLALVCAGAAVFCQPLLLLGCKATLNLVIPSTEGRIVSYEKMQWEKGAIAISGLRIKEPGSVFTADRIELKLSGDFFRLRFAPGVTVVHPQVLLSSADSREAPLFPFLYRTRFFQPSWTIKNGVLELPSSSRFYFSMDPGGGQESIGSLQFSCDPLLTPLFTAEIAQRGRQLQLGFKLEETDLSRLLPLMALVCSSVNTAWEMTSGEIELEGLVFLGQTYGVEELHVRGGGKGIVLASSEMGIALQCEEVQGAFSFPVAGAHGFFWDKISASLALKEGECLLSAPFSGHAFGIRNLNGQIAFEPQKEPQLIFEGLLVQEQREVAFNLLGKGGVEEDATFWSEAELVFTSTRGSQMQSLFSLCSHQGGDLALHMKVDNASFEYLDFLRAFSGMPGECVEGDVSAEATLLYNEKNGRSISVENCLLNKLRWYFPEGGITVYSEQIKGNCGFIWSPELKWALEDLHLQMQGGDYLDSRVHLNSLSADAVVEKGELQPSTFKGEWGGLLAEAIFLKEGKFLANCEGLALRGSIELDSAHAERKRLTLSTSQVAGDVAGVFSVLSKFSSFPQMEIPVDGNFSSGDKGFVLSVPLGPKGGEAEWSFKGSFDSLMFPVNAATSIKDASCDVAIDSKNRRLSVGRGEGTWELIDGMPLTVQIKRMSAQLSEKGILDFALRVVDGKKEFAQIEGIATQALTSGWDVTFERQATHFSGTQLHITRCILNEALGISSFEMKPILKCQDLHAQAAFLQNAGFLPLTFSPKNLKEWQLEGILQTQLFSEDLSRGFSFQAESHDLKVKGEPWTSFHVAGQKIGEKWLVEKLTAGGLLLKGVFNVDAEGLAFPQFEGNWEGLSLKGSGFVKTEKKHFSCIFESVKGDLAVLKMLPKSTWPTSLKGTVIAGVAIVGDFSKLPLQVAGEANLFIDLQSSLPITASNRRVIKFTYGKADGLVCQGIDFQLKHKFSGSYIAELSAEKLVQPAGADTSIHGMRFLVTPELLGFAIDAKILPASLQKLEWEGNLEGSGDLQLGKEGAVFQGNLMPGRYGVDGKSLQFEQIQLRYEKDLLSMRAKMQIQQQPMWASFQTDIAKEPYGMLKLFDNPKADGLKILFSTQNSNLILENVQGSCYGLTCALAKSAKKKVPFATVLVGEIKIDGNVLSKLLPQEIREGIQDVKLGSGYQWQGDLILWQEASKGFLATGRLIGKEFEALGYCFRSLEGTLEACPEYMILSNLKIEDGAGAVGIRKIELNRKADWEFSIPQILVGQLQPSLLRKIGAEQSIVKPFTIKNFTLTDIRGRLGDKASLEGSGHLMFVNQFKKEASILDIPLEMIKKIGLDLGLLTPVQGELQMELRGDKFYLVSLDNSFSEGGRAEFYLSPEKNLSYIDLEGKVHIDLKMRQDVVLKITEPFTITIRGTLDKPRYGLNY